MTRLAYTIRHLWQCASMLYTLLLDAVQSLRRCLRSPASVAAENRLLRKQRALYQERHIKPSRSTTAPRVALPQGQALLAQDLEPWTDPDSGRAASTPPTDGVRQSHLSERHDNTSERCVRLG